MSADNGVYILKTPARPIKTGNCYTNQHGKFEYRVAHCQAIDNIDYSDLYIPLLFGNSAVHRNRDSAMELAVRILDELDICEYGICTIEKENYFPNMTSEEAQKALNAYVTTEGAAIDTVFDQEGYNVVEIVKEKEIVVYLKSKASATWGQGEIPDTEYFLLAKLSPVSLGKKPTVYIAKKSLVEKLQKGL